MKLLIITQIVDVQSRLGFFVEWIKEFSKHTDVEVLCLQKGTFPKSLKVTSLGKEQGTSKATQFFGFFKHIMSKEYDAVFVHMNPIWAVLGGVIWKLKGKKVFMWYTHKSVSSWLVFSKLFVRKYFTATKESFRMNTNKMVVVGHGINPIFSPKLMKREERIITVGRISRIKNLLTIIKAFSRFQKKNKDYTLEIIGECLGEDNWKYKKELMNYIRDNKIENVKFIPTVSQKELVEIYRSSFLSVNASPTGGLDKVVLESLFCKIPVLVNNKTFQNNFQAYFDTHTFSSEEELVKLLNQSVKKRISTDAIYEEIHTKYALSSLIKRILNKMN